MESIQKVKEEMQEVEKENDLLVSIDQNEVEEFERKEKEMKRKERVADLELKWEELQRYRKEHRIFRTSGRSKIGDQERRIQAALAEAKSSLVNQGRRKYEGARMRSLFVPSRVERIDRTEENGWDAEDMKRMNDESDEEYGMYIDE